MRALPDVIDRVAAELVQLARTATRLQEQLGNIAPGQDGIVTLQSLDSLTQGLAGIAEFLSVLARTLPRELRPDLTEALGAVSLAALADRLGQGASPMPPHPAGELELFGP